MMRMLKKLFSKKNTCLCSIDIYARNVAEKNEIGFLLVLHNDRIEAHDYIIKRCSSGRGTPVDGWVPIGTKWGESAEAVLNRIILESGGADRVMMSDNRSVFETCFDDLWYQKEEPKIRYLLPMQFNTNDPYEDILRRARYRGRLIIEYIKDGSLETLKEICDWHEILYPRDADLTIMRRILSNYMLKIKQELEETKSEKNEDLP